MAAASLSQAQTIASAPPPRIIEPVNNASRVTIHGTVSPLANARNDTGPASPGRLLDHVQLFFRKSPSQQASLDQYLKNLQTPGSPNYHKWLTPAEFGQKFGPNQQDISTIENWISSQGFTVEKLNPGNGSLVVSGTVGQLELAFHTSIHRYLVDGQYHYANATDPQIPTALAPVLAGFVSLNNFPAHRLIHYLGKATYDPATGKSQPEWTVSSSSSPIGYDLVMSPADYAVQYDLTPLYQAGTNGSGETIAIINDANININTVNNYRSLFNLPSNPPQVIIAGSDPGIDGINNPDGANGDSIEAYLDVEMAGAIAPNATIDLVIAGDTAVQNGLILAAEYAVFNDIAPIMSVSFGACEKALGSQNQFLNSLWQQAAAEGITVLVASGDSGSAGTDPSGQVCDTSNSASADFGLAVSGYASTPYDVAVGGTDFFYSDYQNPSAITGELQSDWNTSPTPTPQASIKGYITEQAWNDTTLGDNIFQQPSPEIAGGGGGPSTCGMPQTDSSGNVTSCQPYPKPSWQTGPGVPSSNARYIPDVSLFAADGINDSYIPICAVDGDCQPGATPVQISGVGGTSGAAPAMAGIMALVDQKYGPQGQADYVLYPLAQQHPSAFHDVTKGTNAMPCTSGSPNCSNGSLTGYAATPGYDPATGLGTIDANQLVSNWNSISFTSTTTTLSLSSSSFTHGTAVTLNSSVSGSGGTPTGNVAIMTDNPDVNQQSLTSLALSSGQASGSINFLPGGTYNVWAQYSGDGKFGSSTSPKVQVTVNPESSSIIFNAVTSSQSSFNSVAGLQVPYGTQIILDGDVVPTSYYNNCNQGQSTSSSCQNATFGSATGTVVFSDGSSTLNTALINAEGDAEYITGALPVGSHSISAQYSGDSSYNASSASAISFSVVKATPTVTVTPNASSISAGQTLVLAAMVDSGGSGAAPTGSVSFMAGGASLGSASLVPATNPSSGSIVSIATLSLPESAAKSLSITANYGGDSNYAPASSSALAVSVGGASGLLKSTISATATPSSTTSPSSGITLNVTVTGQSGHPAPTGNVNLIIPGSNAQPIALTPGSGDTSTIAFQTLNSQNLAQGATVITFQYVGDTNYQPSSTTITLTNPLADFSMVATTPSVTIPSGGSASATVEFGAINGFNNTVSLSCATSSGYSCSLSPSSVSISGNAPVTATVSITASSSGANRGGPFSWFWGTGGGIAAACVLFFGVPRRRRWQGFFVLIVVAILAVGIGCGGGSSGGTPPSSGGGGTPPPSGGGGSAAATATVVVTGTSGAISHNVSITLKTPNS